MDEMVHGKANAEYCQALLIKNEGYSDTLVWKYPQDCIRLPACLLVGSGEEAIIANDRHILRVFPKGEYALPSHDPNAPDAVSGQIYFVRHGCNMSLALHMYPMLAVSGSDNPRSECVPMRILCDASVLDAPGLVERMLAKHIDLSREQAYEQELSKLFANHLQRYIEKVFAELSQEKEVSPQLFQILEGGVSDYLHHMFLHYGLKLLNLHNSVSLSFQEAVKMSPGLKQSLAGAHMTDRDFQNEPVHLSPDTTIPKKSPVLPEPVSSSPRKSGFGLGGLASAGLNLGMATVGTLAAAAAGMVTAVKSAAKKPAGRNFVPTVRQVSPTPPEIQKLRVSAVAPRQFMKGDYSIVNVVLYEERFRYVVDSLKADGNMQEQSSTVQAAAGSRIRVILSSPDLEIQDDVQEALWCGDYLEFGFGVFMPTNYAKRSILFRAQVYIDGFLATILTFSAKCSHILEQKLRVIRQDILSAFISYSSADRPEVVRVVQGMQKARPDMHIFFDRSSLKSGEEWERALYREIDRSDMLVLCWSRSASQSEWVDKEWRYALEQKGLECIDPVPLEPADLCPPPKELAGKHFNDVLTYLRTTP